MTIDSKKLSLGVVVLGGFALFAAFVLGFISRQMPPPVTTPQNQEQTIVSQQEVYGLSGTVREVRQEDSELVLETVALPYNEFRPQSDQTWLWTVTTTGDTQIILHIPNEEVGEEAPEEEHFRQEAITLESLAAGNAVTVTATEDMALQFLLPEKQIQAKQIDVFEYGGAFE